ncbi:MAG: SDR family oxidoreductase [Candidatus Zixiibacteriota bacterium]|nr:MAG: SDR family oxidoreductase [candidate division Zixibacteria bacterium]
MSKVVFMTGATGNIGAKLVSAILAGDDSCRLILLVRANSAEHARARVKSSVTVVSPEFPFDRYSRRISVLPGDITHDDLGFSGSLYNEVASQVTDIIHSAAATGFLLPVEAARRINLGGTINVMNLARKAADKGQLRGVAHVSTAFVNTGNGRPIGEEDFLVRRDFLHGYDQTKWEAERYIRSAMSWLPVTVFRPSVIVGDSNTGCTSAFNVLYTPLRLICHGQIDTLPAEPEVRLDVVPSDYVADAIHHIFIRKGKCSGRTFHITAGGDKSLTIGQIIDGTLNLAAKYYPRSCANGVRFVAPSLFDAAFGGGGNGNNRIFRMIKVFEPYMTRQMIFDDSGTRAALHGSKIAVKSLSEYFETIVRHCFDTRWGKQVRRAA